MIVKVCGVNNPDNFKDLCQQDIDWMGLNFCPGSPRFIGQGPDAFLRTDPCKPKRVGVFVDEMPQTIISYVYRYKLHLVQLHGSESAVMIRNLQKSIMPDIVQEVKFIKAIPVACADDFARCDEYEGVADFLLFDTKGKLPGGNGKKFDWKLLDNYKGDTPFLLSGGISPDDAELLRNIRHPLFAGVDINSRFEVAPGIKDVDKIKSFIKTLKG